MGLILFCVRVCVCVCVCVWVWEGGKFVHESFYWKVDECCLGVLP